MKKQPRRKRHLVGVNKMYFPRALWPKGFTSYVEMWRILATDRVAAAERVWALHGERLLTMMTPGTKQATLEVDDPRTRMRIGRLRPITVFSLPKENS